MYLVILITQLLKPGIRELKPRISELKPKIHNLVRATSRDAQLFRIIFELMQALSKIA